MKPCPNCHGAGERNYEGDGPGDHPCRMCQGRGTILESGDMAWLARGWFGASGYWYAHEKEKAKLKDCHAFSLPEIMVLILGAEAVGGRLSDEALKERGLSLAWKGVIIHPRNRRPAR